MPGVCSVLSYNKQWLFYWRSSTSDARFIETNSEGKKIFKDKRWTKTKVSNDVICPLSLPFPPLCSQLISFVIVSHRAAQHFFAVKAQRLQCSLIAAPSKVSISVSCSLKFIQLSIYFLWAPLLSLQAELCSAQTSEQNKQLYFSSIVLPFFFPFFLFLFFWITSCSCLSWTSCPVTAKWSDVLWDTEPPVCFPDSISFSKAPQAIH